MNPHHPPAQVTPIYCNDIFVEKTAPDKRIIYRTVLSGECDSVPTQSFFDSQNNFVLIGTTYSASFPTTADALQPHYAGPIPIIYQNATFWLSAGGDLFVSVLRPAGDLLYSTFLGSSGSDKILATRTHSRGQVDVLVYTQGPNFPVTLPSHADPSKGLVYLTLDIDRRSIVRSQYLPIGPIAGPSSFFFQFRNDGTFWVTTHDRLCRFGTEGQSLLSASLDTYDFVGIPETIPGPDGDVWLAGMQRDTSSGRWLVTRLTGGNTEVFRWTLPVFTTVFSAAAFLANDGLFYLGISAYGGYDSEALVTTPNAILSYGRCVQYATGYLAVLDSQGAIRLLSYLPLPPRRFESPDGTSVLAVFGTTPETRLAVDLSQRPKIACIAYGVPNYDFSPPFGVGELIELHGGGFGNAGPLAASIGSGDSYPISLGGTHVRIAGVLAPILSIRPGTVTVAIPFETGGGSLPVVVEEGAQQSMAFPLPVQLVAPKQVGQIVNEDGTLNHANPASAGSVVSIFMTGTGPYNPAVADGQIVPPEMAASLREPVSVTTISGEPVPIRYAGPAPGFVAGTTQINIQLPPNRPSGNSSVIALEIQVGSVICAVYVRVQ